MTSLVILERNGQSTVFNLLDILNHPKLHVDGCSAAPISPPHPPDTCCTVQGPQTPEHAGHHGPKTYGSSATASATARAMVGGGSAPSARLDLHAPQALRHQAVVLALQERLVLCAVPQPLLDNESSESLLDVAAREVLRPRLLDEVARRRLPTLRRDVLAQRPAAREVLDDVLEAISNQSASAGRLPAAFPPLCAGTTGFCSTARLYTRAHGARL